MKPNDPRRCPEVMDDPGALGPPLRAVDRALGSARRWSSDLALIGAASSFLAPFTIFGWSWVGYPVIAGVLGAVSGGVLGPVLRRLFHGVLGKTKVAPLLIAGLGVGAAWGAFVAAGAAAVLTLLEGSGYLFSIIPLAAVCGAAAGAVQLGWFWLPYLLRRAHGRSVWPVLLGASLLAPALGYLGVGLLGWVS